MFRWFFGKEGLLFLVVMLLYFAATYTYAKNFQVSFFFTNANVISIPVFVYYILYFSLLVVFSQGSVYFLYSISRSKGRRKNFSSAKKFEVGKESKRPERVSEVVKPDQKGRVNVADAPSKEMR